MVKVNGPKLGVTASIGVALYPRDGITAEELISCSDSAMYRAKQNRNSICVHCPAEDGPVRELSIGA